MKKFLLLFCFLLSATFLCAETISLQNLKIDKDYKSNQNKKLVNKILKNIDFYIDDIKKGNITFEKVIKKIMDNNISSIVKEVKTIHIKSTIEIHFNHFIFGYNCNTIEKLNKEKGKIPLLITEQKYYSKTTPSAHFYSIIIYGTDICVVNINTGDKLDFYDINETL